MYLSHFGLDRDPFSLTPNPRFLFLSERYRDALALLIYGMEGRGGFVQLTGEVGTGKTTLCRSLLDKVPDDVDIALILNPRLTALELLSSICDELQIPWPPGTQSVKVLVDALNRYLLDAHARGRRTALIIDEAQQLSADVLEQVRLLTNLETATAKLLQVVLIGQPELEALMERPELRQLSQRVTARYRLNPLSAQETAAYIRHRLEVAGCSEPLFTSDAVRRVYRLSGGIPRLINVICDRALLGAYARDRRRVSARLVSLAGHEVTGRRSGRLAVGVLGATVGIVVLVAALAWWAWPWIRSGGPARSAVVQPSANGVRELFQAPLASGQSLQEWLSDRELRAGVGDAEMGLLRIWHLPPDLRPGVALCDRAVSAGLACVEGRGGWEALEQYNRPASLELTTQGRVRYVLLVALEGDQVVLAADERRARFPRADVERSWTGHFALLWKRPPFELQLVRLLGNGPEVRWVEERLDLFEGRRAAAGPRPRDAESDAGLRKRVIAFQRTFGLAADGRVGPKTLVQLSSIADDPSTPVLRPFFGGRS